jgi:FkbM family methyltransferase
LRQRGAGNTCQQQSCDQAEAGGDFRSPCSRTRLARNATGAIALLLRHKLFAAAPGLRHQAGGRNLGTESRMTSLKRPFRGFGLGIMRRLRGTPPAETELVIRECRQLIRGGVFFDIGANVGRVSEAVLPLASRVVAVEPDPKTFAELSTRLGDQAICVEALVGPEGAERTFLLNTIASSSSTSVAPGKDPPGHDELVRSTMQAISLDRLAREHGRPDLIKIDVEGCELAVLESGRDLLASRPVVVMEFNTLCLSVFGGVNPYDAISHILRVFPKVEIITPEGRTRVTDAYGFLSENILTRGALDNLVCSWD